MRYRFILLAVFEILLIGLSFGLLGAQVPDIAAAPLIQQPGTPTPELDLTPVLTSTLPVTGTLSPTTIFTVPVTATLTPTATLALTSTEAVTGTMAPEGEVTEITETVETPETAEGTPTETRTPLPPIIDVQPREVARTLASRMIISALILVSAWLVATVARNLLSSLLIRLHPHVQVFVARLVYIGVWIVAILSLLSVFGVEVATLTAIVGTLGLAFSLSSQDLFKNFIAGIYLLLERPFVLGDTIEVGEYSGKVEFVDLRTTILRTDDGQQVILPNTLMMSQVVVRRFEVPPPAEPIKPEGQDLPEENTQ